MIWIFAPDGTFKGLFGRPGDGPGDFEFTRPACRDCPGAGALTFAPDGSLFVADVGNHRVQKFNAEREFETEWGEFGAGEGQFADATQIATNGSDVFVADDVRLDTQVFDVDGRFHETLPMAGWLAVGSSGDLFVNSRGVVSRFDEGGQVGAATELPAYRGAWHMDWPSMMAAACSSTIRTTQPQTRSGSASSIRRRAEPDLVDRRRDTGDRR